MDIRYCDRTEAKVLADFGHKVYAELDQYLKPSKFFTEVSVDALIKSKKVIGKGRHRLNRRKPNRRMYPSWTILKLTKTSPHFVESGTNIYNSYQIVKTYLEANVDIDTTRRELEDRVMEQLGLSTSQTSSIFSQLLYVKKALEADSNEG